MPSDFRDVDPKRLPSLQLAYEFVSPSYDEVVERLTLIEGRLGALATTAATATLAIPTLTDVKLACDLPSFSFGAAVLCGAVVTSVGLWRRNGTRLYRVDPTKLENHLGKKPDRFRQEMLYWAGKHYAKNQQAVDKLVGALRWLTGLFALEVALLVAWLVLRQGTQ